MQNPIDTMRIRRIILKYLLFMWTLYTVIFISLNFAVGDPTFYLLGPFSSIDTIERLRNSLGLNQPLIIRYFYQLKSFYFPSQLTSIYYHRSVLYLIEHMGAYTLLYIFGVYLIATLFGGFLGIFTKPFKWNKKLYWIFRLSLIPTYIGGLIAFWFLNSLGISTSFFQKFYQILLVFLTSFHPTMLTAYMLNNGIINEFSSQTYPYLYFAKGLPYWKINFYLSRRFIPSTAAQLIALLGYIVSSVFFFEFLFNVPGIGNIFINAILRNDGNVVLSITLILGSITYISYLIGEEIIGNIFKYKLLTQKYRDSQ